MANIKQIDNSKEIKLGNFNSVEEMKQWADEIIESGLLPKQIDTPEQVITIVQTGTELGLTPHIALQNIHVIQGRPTISSAMLGALLKRRGIEWIWDEDYALIPSRTPNDDDPYEMIDEDTPNRITTIHFFWKSKVINKVMDTTFSFTLGQAVLAGYTAKDNYSRLPKEMLRSRCLSSAVRYLFPEVLLGLYTDVEINDSLPEKDARPMDIEDGEVVVSYED